MALSFFFFLRTQVFKLSPLVNELTKRTVAASFMHKWNIISPVLFDFSFRRSQTLDRYMNVHWPWKPPNCLAQVNWFDVYRHIICLASQKSRCNSFCPQLQKCIDLRYMYLHVWYVQSTITKHHKSCPHMVVDGDIDLMKWMAQEK